MCGRAAAPHWFQTGSLTFVLQGGDTWVSPCLQSAVLAPSRAAVPRRSLATCRGSCLFPSCTTSTWGWGHRSSERLGSPGLGDGDSEVQGEVSRLQERREPRGPLPAGSPAGRSRCRSPRCGLSVQDHLLCALKVESHISVLS